MKSPLVSINIPTLNSEKTLPRTLESIKNQTYKKYEVIIVDSYSKDKTAAISKKFKAKVILDKGQLLGARFQGFKASKGKYVICIDSDQVLHHTMIQRGVEMLESGQYDMLILEEASYKPRTIIERLSAKDREVYHKKRVLDPTESVLLPRMFKYDLLKKVFAKIDPKLHAVVSLQDHAIIYYESYKISKRVGYLPDAVYHDEPKTIKELFKHYYKWGYRAGEKAKQLPREYQVMFDNKLNSRHKNIHLFSPSFVLILPIILIKGAGYYSGIVMSKFKKKN